MRAFVAITPGPGTGHALQALQSRLPVGRPLPGRNLHLTLAFLDDQPEDRLEALHYRLQAIKMPAFDLQISGLGCFGGARPKLLFAGLHDSPALGALRDQVISAVRQSGIQPKKDRFRPHVTLARFRRPPGGAEARALAAFLEAEAGFLPPPFRVDGFALCQSTLMHTGAVHDELARYALA